MNLFFSEGVLGMIFTTSSDMADDVVLALIVALSTKACHFEDESGSSLLGF